MNGMKFAAVAALAASYALTASAEPLPANIAGAAKDPVRAEQAKVDAVRHGPEILAFAGVETGAKVVDLFYKIGASRGKNITPLFEKAYQADRVLALRTLFWARDIRGGAGERQIFRDLLLFIEANHFQDLN